MNKNNRFINKWPPYPLNRREFLKLSALGVSTLLPMGALTACSQEENTDIYDVIIIGGGVSGLTSAWLMQDRNIVVLEKEAESGGRVINGQWEGFNYALGAAYIGKPDNDISEFFAELGLKAIPVPPPVDALAYKGILYPEDYFASALDNINSYRDYMKVGKKMTAFNEQGIEEAVYEADLDTLSDFEQLDQISVKQWLNSEGIDPLVQQYINIENRGLFGASNADMSFLFDIAEMSFNLYNEEIGEDDYKTEPVPDFHSYQPSVKQADSALWTFKNGMIDLIWAFEKKLGSKIKNGALVNSVVVNADKTVSVTYSQNGKEQTIRAYAAILATPAPITASIVKSGLSNTVIKALKNVLYTTYVTMAIYLSNRLFKNAWNIAGLDTTFTALNDAIRMQVPLDYTGKSILGVAMPPANVHDQSLLAMSDQVLLEQALKDIEKYFPSVRKNVIGKDIHRFKYAFPVFAPGYGQTLWQLHKDKSTKGPLFLAGDYMVYPTLGGAGASAYRAYELISEYAESL